MKIIKVEEDCLYWVQDYLCAYFHQYGEYTWTLKEVAEEIIEASDWSGDEIDSLYTEGQKVLKELAYEIKPGEQFKFDWSEE